jgi:transposase
VKQTTPRTRRKFDDNFKSEAVNHWRSSGKSAETVAQELGIGSNLLYAWSKSLAPVDAGGRAAAGAKPTTLAQAQAQLQAAEREIRHLREQRDILKKTLGILSEPPKSATNGSMP